MFEEIKITKFSMNLNSKMIIILYIPYNYGQSHLQINLENIIRTLMLLIMLMIMVMVMNLTTITPKNTGTTKENSAFLRTFCLYCVAAAKSVPWTLTIGW